jgi:hypothetical protein
MHAALTRPVALGALVVLGACSSMQRVPVNYINDQKPEVVHLANSYGIVTTLEHPTLSGDTVRGVAWGQNDSVAVPLEQVESISTVRFSTGRTVALVTGATGVTALMVWAMFGQSSGSNENWECDWGLKDPLNGNGPTCGPKS